jgi:hypothetical protein
MLRTAVRTFSGSSVAWEKTRTSMYPIGGLEDTKAPRSVRELLTF